MAKPKSKSGAPFAGALSKIPVVPIVIIIAAIMFLTPLRKAFSNVLGGLGLMGKSDETKTVDAETTKGTGSPWSPAYYKTCPAGAHIIRVADADAICKQIVGAFGPFNDNEEQAKGAIKNNIRYQSAMSFVCERWQLKYPANGSLLDYLRGGNWPQDRLSDADVAELVSYVSSLPKY